jgi:hypothetical protein
MERDEHPQTGTYGAIVRSDTPLDWRRMLHAATFTIEDFVNKGPDIVQEKARAILDELRERGGGR